MEILDFDIAIIGGGAVGLACARALSKSSSKKILVLDRNERLGSETTSRNSEVIHAGIYYAPDSLKEKLCLRGKELLYDYVQKKGVPYRKCGKLVVGNSENDREALGKIRKNAERVGVEIRELGEKQVAELEPNVKASFALLSPTTGIICSESFVQALAADCTDRGVEISSRTTLTRWEKSGKGYLLIAKDSSGTEFGVRAPIVVNSAGLASLEIARPTIGPDFPYEMKFVRGHYVGLSGRFRNVASHLIYPVPDYKGGGLGIHLTLDLEGNARLGPDTDWRYADRVEYRFFEEDEKSLLQKFYGEGRKYLPQISLSDLSPGFVGVRPKLVTNGNVTADFYIEEETKQGYPGWINLIGIESPGLTSALAIGAQVEEWVTKHA